MHMWFGVPPFVSGGTASKHVDFVLSTALFLHSYPRVKAPVAPGRRMDSTCDYDSSETHERGPRHRKSNGGQRHETLGAVRAARISCNPGRRWQDASLPSFDGCVVSTHEFTFCMSQWLLLASPGLAGLDACAEWVGDAFIHSRFYRLQ